MSQYAHTSPVLQIFCVQRQTNDLQGCVRATKRFGLQLLASWHPLCTPEQASQTIRLQQVKGRYTHGISIRIRQANEREGAQAFRNATLAKKFGAHKGAKGKTGGSKGNAWLAYVGKKK